MKALSRSNKIIFFLLTCLLALAALSILWEEKPKPNASLHLSEIGRLGIPSIENRVAYKEFLLSPNNELIAVRSSNRIEVWNLNTRSLATIIDEPYGVYEFGVFAWSPDSSQIATIVLDTELSIWEVSTGELVRTYEGVDLHSNGVRAIQWHLPDIITTGSFEYLLWSVESENTPEIVNCHPFGSLLWWSPNGDYIATMGGESSLVWICNSQFERLLSIEGYKAVAWSPDGTKIASVGIFNTLRVWSISTGEVLSTSEGGETNILEISWHSEGHLIATRHLNDEIRIWEQMTPDAFWLVGNVYIPELNDAAWLGNQLITTSNKGMIQIWNFD